MQKSLFEKIMLYLIFLFLSACGASGGGGGAEPDSQSGGGTQANPSYTSGVDIDGGSALDSSSNSFRLKLQSVGGLAQIQESVSDNFKLKNKKGQ